MKKLIIVCLFFISCGPPAIIGYPEDKDDLSDSDYKIYGDSDSISGDSNIIDGDSNIIFGDSSGGDADECQGKIVICHKPDKEHSCQNKCGHHGHHNVCYGRTIEIDCHALKAHLNHGDYIGECFG